MPSIDFDSITRMIDVHWNMTDCNGSFAHSTETRGTDLDRAPPQDFDARFGTESHGNQWFSKDFRWDPVAQMLSRGDGF